MTTISNNYSSNAQTTGSSSKPAAESETQEVSLWESFCNEVIAPAIEDATYSYFDENFGTNLAEQKQQKELEKTYEEVLAKEEEQNNKSLEDITNDFLGELLVDGFNSYCDTNFNTNLGEQKEQKQQNDAKLLKEAHEYKAQQEAQQEAQASKTNFLSGLLGLIFGSKKD